MKILLAYKFSPLRIEEMALIIFYLILIYFYFKINSTISSAPALIEKFCTYESF